jgi:hypothetical protein
MATFSPQALGVCAKGHKSPHPSSTALPPQPGGFASGARAGHLPIQDPAWRLLADPTGRPLAPDVGALCGAGHEPAQCALLVVDEDRCQAGHVDVSAIVRPPGPKRALKVGGLGDLSLKPPGPAHGGLVNRRTLEPEPEAESRAAPGSGIGPRGDQG